MAELDPVLMGSDRAAELVHALASVRRRIAGACDDAGRERSAVTLVAVTKSFPPVDLQILLGLGVTDVGESRDQEARAKFPVEWARGDVTVHFIGQLQTNKCRSVVRYSDVVQSVDRLELVQALDQAVEREARPDAEARRLAVLLQVNLDHVDATASAATGRGGVRPDGVLTLAAAVAATSTLSLRGVMGVAPRDEQPERAFDLLRTVSARLMTEHPHANLISSGMSNDFEQAIHYGSTHVRVGSALLGQRAPNLG